MTEYLLSIYRPLVPFDSVTTWVTHLNSLKKKNKKERRNKKYDGDVCSFPLLLS